MSYRDVRNLIEMLRALGYPQLISMESFRRPNFALEANLLVWLAKRFDPDFDMNVEISEENARVNLIRKITEFMALKANVKLNTKRLYQADGYCVKELLKITTILYEALNIYLNESDKEKADEDSNLSLKDFDISDKVNDLKFSRQLASEITTTGANLFDLLGKEVELRTSRYRSIARQIELSDVESAIKNAIKEITKEIGETKQMIDNIAVTESSLDSKIERRNIEIDRYEKRLQTLKKVRPAFLEEFTALEQELEQLFVQYSVRLRCLNQLEKQFKESERIQTEKQLQLTVPQIQTIPLEKFDEDDMMQTDQGVLNRQERPRASTGGRKRSEKDTKVYGSMQPPLFGSQSSLDLSTDSESDDLFIDKDEPELMHSDDESLALELSVDRRAPSGRKTKIPENNSDDDF